MKWNWRGVVATSAVCVSLSLAAQQVKPANAQLASPEIERRVNALLKQMTLEEKIGQLVQYNDMGQNVLPSADNKQVADNPDAKLGIDPLKLAGNGGIGSMLNIVGAQKTHIYQQAAMEKSRLHIPLLFGADVIHGYRTIYPVPLGLASTWDTALVRDLSAMSAAEATTGGIRWFYSPMVDVARDARWGRIVEGAGEDPYLGSAMARAYIDGYQGTNLGDTSHVAASVKHFAAYGAAEGGREYNTTDMSLSRMHQVYLPPYRAAVQEGAATMMSAFNSLNGVPSTANPYIMTDLLRKTWGFDGFVVSDYSAVMELTHHGVALTAADATKKALEAGVEVDMMSHYYDAELPTLVKSGKVPMSVVDEAVRRVLRVKFALGLFEHPYASGTEVTRALDEHRPLVRKAAEESFVLLKNDHDVLPLAANAKKIALIGPLANDGMQMIGSWGGANHKGDTITLKDAMEARASKSGATLTYAKGVEIKSTDESGFAAALDAARGADVVVMALGEDAMMSGEAGARAHLDLPGAQQQLMEQIAALGKPTVLVLFSGRPLVLTWAAKHVDAILQAWFPGTEAGNALANVLYGDASPSGRLTVSFPYTVGQEPLYYAQFPTGRPTGDADLSVPPGPNSRFLSRYIDAPNDALYPFGYGLSYTTFSFSDVKLSSDKLMLKDVQHAGHITATATVTNTGKRAGSEVVQCYVRNRGASMEQPMRELKGFRRVELAAGESKTVSFDLGFDELSFWNNEGKQVIEPTEYTVFVGGDSRADHQAMFHIVQ
ncbi:glycoside hydrolase family 3 N-terminal domain-containing protein [Granulicella cerasi]|uniref:beta-glucosidase n=1 Tax=Granulicella cerasi TaxID=741063 RepID=A0ABW1Z844_9BACT|nr:glycoside hydrolase family 3 N-terminal domain-containing protein [Granulicella cerasi]